MSGSAGGVNFFSLSGPPRLPAETLEMLFRSDVDGVALRKSGVRGAPWVATGLADISSGGLETFLEAIHALQGTLVTMTLGNGLTRNNVAVLLATPEEIRPIAQAQGGLLGAGSSGYLCAVRFDLVCTE